MIKFGSQFVSLVKILGILGGIMNASSRKTLTAILLAVLGTFSICNLCLWCPMLGMVTRDFVIAINTLTPRFTLATASSTALPTVTGTPTASQTVTGTFTNTSAPSSTATNTSLPSSTFTATITPSPTEAPICACSADLVCKDFNSQNDAQRCFDYCVAQGHEEVGVLDNDKDKLACEENPTATP